jgi:CRISPR-associated exonuclease Cas4
MFPEDALLPISALQHLLYCPRQCALIHLERLWAENSLTREGRHLHEKADHGRGETQPGKRIARGLLLRSLELGLAGKADVVEFHSQTGTSNQQLTTGNLLIPFPVEYKRGRPKKNGCDLVQLCAQALCLEEMLGVAVPAGALFYGKTRRRLDVAFDEALRRLTLETIGRLHAMIGSGVTPAAVYEPKKCDQCSLRFLCLPKAASKAASRYFQRALAGAAADDPPEGE